MSSFQAILLVLAGQNELLKLIPFPSMVTVYQGSSTWLHHCLYLIPEQYNKMGH
uniref:Uncharacterized protein n=1 Tax=Arundo donax TaxID=35708 RepID=A0A0A9BVZ4_ARUDO